MASSVVLMAVLSIETLLSTSLVRVSLSEARVASGMVSLMMVRCMGVVACWVVVCARRGGVGEGETVFCGESDVGVRGGGGCCVLGGVGMGSNAGLICARWVGGESVSEGEVKSVERYAPVVDNEACRVSSDVCSAVEVVVMREESVFERVYGRCESP